MSFPWQRSNGKSETGGGCTGYERTLTNLTGALSVLRLVSASHDGMNVTVTWQSESGVDYFLECSTNLAATPRFTLLATNLVGPTGTNTFTDPEAAVWPRVFYRLGVETP